SLWKANPFRYSGYQYDDKTGLYYLKSRYYSPFIGRFITRDAVFALNLYSYAANNPTNFVDPDGFVPIDDKGVAHPEAMNRQAGEKNFNSNKSYTETARNVGLTITTNTLTNEKVLNELKESDETYKSIKGVSSGVPKAAKVAGKGLEVYSVFEDIKSLRNEKSAFKAYLTTISLGSNLKIVGGMSTPLSVSSSVFKEVYDYCPTEVQKVMDYFMLHGGTRYLQPPIYNPIYNY
ncbi:MAG: RHS repeat-associated core domain-containing protein, partial [Firmicutes bacterium]|nr:RHS repeat-associated core domain-containing protein [Bacillota bacterium]